MRVPLSWLSSFVDVDDLPLRELVETMNRVGLEVDDVVRPGAGTAGVRVKRVQEWRPHPDADRLRVVQVSDGETTTELVCGAANFDVGDLVAHAEVGATIPGRDGPFRLEARPLRGVVSHGMLTSAAELQLGEDHAGIMVLDAAAPGVEPGVDLRDVLPVGEPVIDVEVLADRGDHHSVLGIARELAAALDRPLTMPSIPTPPAPSDPVAVQLAAGDGCRRFVTRVVDDVDVAVPTPWTLRQRLAQCGIRSLGLVVDVTNYVMLELGQPLHAFDLDRLAGPELVVRYARDGETLTTLDDVTRTLAAGDLVISDADGPTSLAGVMGGARSEVTGATSAVLLEAATWHPGAIRATATRLGLTSEASHRFARGVDPAGADRAVLRAAALLAEHGTGVPGGIGIAGRDPSRPAPVVCSATRVQKLLGIPDLDVALQADLLRRLGADVDVDGDRLTVTPPTWRGDLARPADVAEEVARLHGYDRIPATLPRVEVRGGRPPEASALDEVAVAARAAGLHEVRTRPFLGPDVLAGAVPSAGRVRLENPLAAHADGLAPTLLEGLLGVVRRNVGQGVPGIGVHEVARIFRPADDPLAAALREAGALRPWTGPDDRPLPAQPRTLGLAAQGRRAGRGWVGEEPWAVPDLLFVLDEVAIRLCDPTDPEPLRRHATTRDGWHPGRTVALSWRGVELGVAGQLHPDEADRRDLPEPVVAAELVLEPLLRRHVEGSAATPGIDLVTLPALNVDVALVAPDDVPHSVLVETVRQGAGDLLDDLRVFDVYRGEQVPDGARSVAMTLRLQAPDRQLTDADGAAVIDRVAEAAEAVGATMRR